MRYDHIPFVNTSLFNNRLMVLELYVYMLSTAVTDIAVGIERDIDDIDINTDTDRDR